MGNKLTVSTWIKWNGHSEGSARIGGFQGYFGDYALWIINDGRILFEVDGQHGNVWYSVDKIERNKWYHIAATFDINYARIFINGKIVLEKGVNYCPPAQGTANLRIGNKENSYFNGLVDDFIIFNRVLSISEILRLYADQGGQEGYVRFDFPKPDLNLDFTVDFSDLNILKQDFLRLAANLANPRSDIDGDGQATIKDAGIMMSEWGK